MHAQESASVKRSGILLGYLLSYFLFTTLLFLISILLGRHSLTYPKMMLITGSITAFGFFLGKALR